MGNLSDALQTFEKLLSLTPNSPDVLHHIAALYDARGDYTMAAQYYGVLVTRVPNDAAALARLGAVFAKADDEQQALHFTTESFRLMPTSLDVIAWLGVWCVRGELFDGQLTASTSWLPSPTLTPALSRAAPYHRYVKSELYEKAEAFFQRAALLQPAEAKWRLMVSSTCTLLQTSCEP